MPTSTIEVLPSPKAHVSAEERPKRVDGYTILLVSVTLLAAILRIHGIAFKSFWLDEGLSVEYARLPWPQLLHTLSHMEPNMAPYYLLLRYWLLLGHTDGFVRGLSALFSIATVPLLYTLGKELFNRKVAIVASFLLSLHAFQVRYAQEARGYAMVVFLTVLASWLLVRSLQRPSAKLWGVYTAVCVLAVYTQFYSGLVVAAHLVALAFLPRDKFPWKPVLRHLISFACLVAPIGFFVVTADLGRISWMLPISERVLLGLGFDLSGNYGRPLLILTVLLIAMALFTARRISSARNNTKEAWSYAFVLAWLLVPIAAVVGVSLYHPLLVDRYLNPCVPALALVVAGATMALRPDWLRWPALALISAFLFLGTASYYDRDFDTIRQDWRAAESYVAARALPGDSIYFYAGAGECLFDFYQRQRNPVPSWPKVLNTPFVEDSISKAYELIPGTELRALRPAGDRVWIVFLLPYNPNGGPDTDGAKVRDWLAAGRRRVDVQRLPPIDIVLFDKQTAPPSSNSIPPP